MTLFNCNLHLVNCTPSSDGLVRTVTNIITMFMMVSQLAIPYWTTGSGLGMKGGYLSIRLPKVEDLIFQFFGQLDTT